MEGTIVLEGLRIEEEVWGEEEEEDTLSLCDLQIYDNDSEEWENCYDTKSSSRSFSSSSYSSEQDLFEFFSEESSKNNSFSHNQHPESIVFCGKIIPYRNPITSESTNKNQIEAKKKQRSEKQSKQSIVSSVSLSKRSWYMFLFGSAGVPTEMELKDLKTRQSRKVIASSSSSASSSSCSTLCRVKNGDDKGRGKGNKGMWRLIKALSCTGGATYHAQSVVKASIGCISLV